MGSIINKPHNAGYTLIELIVAISLATIAAAFIFSSYIDIVHGFKIHVKRAESVREMISAKIKIAKAVQNVGSLVLIAPDKLMFVEQGDSTTHTMEYHNEELYRDGRSVQNKLESFVFRPSEAKTTEGHRVVAWEGTLGSGGWVGGAIIARDMTPVK